jgi:ADP-ribose pyrophosphatase YjhB (NUDIX family)
MTKVVSCGIVPIRKNGDDIEILLCVPIEGSYAPSNGSFYGMGFLKGQVENDESNLETAKREFAEESGDLQIELFGDETYFTQNNPKKKIYIWPAVVLPTEFNYSKIGDNGVVHDHDDENALIKFYPITNLPPIFRNQQQILEDLLEFIDENKESII